MYEAKAYAVKSSSSPFAATDIARRDPRSALRAFVDVARESVSKKANKTRS